MKKITLTILYVLCTFNLFAQANLKNGLLAYYPLNGNFNDSSGNGRHAAQVGGVLFGTDQLGKTNGAALLDGINDYIELVLASGVSPDTALSITFRFKATNSKGVLVSKATWVNFDNIQYQVAYNYPSFSVDSGLFLATEHNNNCSASTMHYTASGDTTPVNQWLCGVVTFSKGIKTVYVDGIKKMQDTVKGQNNSTSIDTCKAGSIRIGAWWSGDPQYYKGLIDDVRFYNRALNQVEVGLYCSRAGDTVTGVGDQHATNDIKVFPNPAADLIIITGIQQQTDAIIYSPTASIMTRHVLTRKEERLDISRLPAGMYFIKLSAGTETKVIRFLKQ